MDVLGSQREVLQVPIPDGGTGTLLDFFRVMAASGRIIGLFTVAIFGSFSNSFSAHFHVFAKVSGYRTGASACSKHS